MSSLRVTRKWISWCNRRVGSFGGPANILLLTLLVLLFPWSGGTEESGHATAVGSCYSCTANSATDPCITDVTSARTVVCPKQYCYVIRNEHGGVIHSFGRGCSDRMPGPFNACEWSVGGQQRTCQSFCEVGQEGELPCNRGDGVPPTPPPGGGAATRASACSMWSIVTANTTFLLAIKQFMISWI